MIQDLLLRSRTQVIIRLPVESDKGVSAFQQALDS